MASTKPRIVIIGAGIAGLAAANKLFTSPNSNQLFELLVVEGGARIGGRIYSSEFCGDRIEKGATWIHGIEGSPLYRIAQEANCLHSEQPWEGMNGFFEKPIIVAEGGHELDPSVVEPMSRLFKCLMDFVKGKPISKRYGDFSEVLKHCAGDLGENNPSIGTFLRRGLESYWGFMKDKGNLQSVGNWSKKSLEEAIFGMCENEQKVVDGVEDLFALDFSSEREYQMFPGPHFTIARGYSRVVESLASVLPIGAIQFGKKIVKIEWQQNDVRPVKLHFCNGSSISADHVIVTVSLGVLKQGISPDCSMFSPPLPDFKNQAISRLGYGVIDKVFLQIPAGDSNFPWLEMVFHKPNSELRDPNIPNWIRGTSSIYPIYRDSRVVVSWFTGKEAVEMESLSDEEIINGFSRTASNLLSKSNFKFPKVLRSDWGTDPLFLGSYSYIAVGSSGDDFDALAVPLPEKGINDDSSVPQLQLLFAGEATHRTHFSSTHGAYLSGIREADRLLKHYVS